jgi:hypothetical protein
VNLLAQRALELRAAGVDTLTVQPTPERSASPLLEYGLGDTIPVGVSKRLRQARLTRERVYGIGMPIDDNGVESVDGLLLSRQGFDA